MNQAEVERRCTETGAVSPSGHDPGGPVRDRRRELVAAPMAASDFEPAVCSGLAAMYVDAERRTYILPIGGETVGRTAELMPTAQELTIYTNMLVIKSV